MQQIIMGIYFVQGNIPKHTQQFPSLNLFFLTLLYLLYTSQWLKFAMENIYSSFWMDFNKVLTFFPKALVCLLSDFYLTFWNYINCLFRNYILFCVLMMFETAVMLSSLFGFQCRLSSCMITETRTHTSSSKSKSA